MKKLILVVILFFAIPFGVQAAAIDTKADIDLHVSTLGLGIGVAVPFSETLSGRLSLNKYTYSYQSTSSGTQFDGNLKLESMAALADWHLFNGVTHLTAGLIYNNNSIDMTATAVGGNITVNNQTYTSSQVGSLTTEITFNKMAPYLGFGWSGRSSKKGLSFNSDFGIMFQGAPTTKMTASGAAADPALAADVAAAQTQLDSDLQSFNRWLVISIGLAYAF
jgi:hypothetical protein